MRHLFCFLACPSLSHNCRHRMQMVLSVLGIAGGTALAAYGEVHNSVLGLVIMFTSEAFEAIRLVMTQLLLAGHKMGPFEGVMWMVSCCRWGGVGNKRACGLLVLSVPQWRLGGGCRSSRVDHRCLLLPSCLPAATLCSKLTCSAILSPLPYPTIPPSPLPFPTPHHNINNTRPPPAACGCCWAPA